MVPCKSFEHQSMCIYTANHLISLLFLFSSEAEEFRKRSQAVQRDMPRPADVNTTVLRPPEMQRDLNAYQVVSQYSSR